MSFLTICLRLMLRRMMLNRELQLRRHSASAMEMIPVHLSRQASRRWIGRLAVQFMSSSYGPDCSPGPQPSGTEQDSARLCKQMRVEVTRTMHALRMGFVVSD